MIDPAGHGRGISATATILSTAGTTQPSKSQTFASAFSSELASQETGAGGPPIPGEDSSPGRGIVARHNPGVPSAGTTRTTIPSPSVSSAPAPGSVTASSTNVQSASSFDKAYWASQPAAVQQLQNVDPVDRSELATQLANEGYSIDVPIMVWGWDPSTTMATRQADGYTWVPSALQQPVAVAPGLTFNGTAYNPANPPAGSITVT